MPETTVLAGRRILVVEDDFFLASDTARALGAAGAEIVGPIPRTAPALDVLARGFVDAAVVDINLGDGPMFELPDALRDAGIPFVFVTGYDEVQIPRRFANIATVLKPADMRALVQAVKALFAR